MLGGFVVLFLGIVCLRNGLKAEGEITKLLSPIDFTFGIAITGGGISMIAEGWTSFIENLGF